MLRLILSNQLHMYDSSPHYTHLANVMSKHLEKTFTTERDDMYVEICIMNHKGPFHTNTTPQTLFNSSTTHYRTQKTCEGYSASPTALSRPRAGPTPTTQ